MDRRARVFLLPALLACSPAEPAKPEPDAVASTPAPVSEPAPEPTPTPEPVVVVAPKTATLRLVAVREGSMALRGGWLMIDGEPVEIDDAGRVVRNPEFGRGLAPLLQDMTAPATLAFVGDPRGIAFVTTQLDHDRATTQYEVHAREGDVWKRRQLAHGLTIEFHPSLFTRGDAILGLRAYAANPDADGANEEESDFNDRLLPALAALEPGFVQLAGPTVELPRLPAGVDLASAATSSDGTLYGITRKPPRRSWDEDDANPEWKPSLLVWAPASNEPSTLALPNYSGESSGENVLSLSIAGDRALIGGETEANKPYLLVVHGETIEPVTDDLTPALTQRSGWVSSAARSPAGDLWMSVGEWMMADETVPESLWHRPAASSKWVRVELPLPSNEQVGVGKPRWAFSHYERRWHPVEGAVLRASPAEGIALQVAWLRDALWIVGDLGTPLENGTEIDVMDVHRSVLYTTHAGADPVVVLPSFDQLIVERLAAVPVAKGKPGKDKCYRFSMIVPATIPSTPDLAAIDESGFGLTLAQIDALEAGSAIEDAEDYASLELLYVGEIEGRRELVISAAAGDPKLAVALQAEVEAMLGSKPTLDCRPRVLVRLVRELGGA